jgi:hypothetical protein
VDTDGSISYSLPHSTRRPPGAQIGGFYSYQILASCSNTPQSILSWESYDGDTGLWACQVSPGIPISHQAVLKASTAAFAGAGCLPLDGLRMAESGTDFGAWTYT